MLKPNRPPWRNFVMQYDGGDDGDDDDHQWLYSPCKDLGRLTPEVSESY
jgi:hypothetical protein